MFCFSYIALYRVSWTVQIDFHGICEQCCLAPNCTATIIRTQFSLLSLIKLSLINKANCMFLLLRKCVNSLMFNLPGFHS